MSRSTKGLKYEGIFYKPLFFKERQMQILWVNLAPESPNFWGYLFSISSFPEARVSGNAVKMGYL